MAPSGGATTGVDQAMTWSPENSTSVPFSAKAMWFAVWPGVATASIAHPSPATMSPSASAVSGRKSRSPLASSRGASPTLSGRRGRMIAVGMGDEDVRHRLASHGLDEGRDVRLVERPWIDDGDPALSDDVADRPLEG